MLLRVNVVFDTLEPTLTNFVCPLANFHSLKWPNIEK